jgi:hypothetical protein
VLSQTEHRRFETLGSVLRADPHVAALVRAADRRRTAAASRGGSRPRLVDWRDDGAPGG